MVPAYSAADLIVSRAGAIAISELSMVQKPVILVPLPTAAEDHQTKNAEQLAWKNAAIMVKDINMKTDFLPALLQLAGNAQLRSTMAENIRFFAKPNATEKIVDEIIKTLP